MIVQAFDRRVRLPKKGGKLSTHRSELEVQCVPACAARRGIIQLAGSRAVAVRRSYIVDSRTEI